MQTFQDKNQYSSDGQVKEDKLTTTHIDNRPAYLGMVTVQSNKQFNQTPKSNIVTMKNTNSNMSQKQQKNYPKKNSQICWTKLSRHEESWNLISNGKFSTAQRGDEESRRNRVYKNFIREKGQHKETSKQWRWKQKYFALHLHDNENEIKEKEEYSSSYSDDETDLTQANLSASISVKDKENKDQLSDSKKIKDQNTKQSHLGSMGSLCNFFGGRNQDFKEAENYLKNKLKNKKNEYKYRRFMQQQNKDQNEMFTNFVQEESLDEKFKLKRQIEDMQKDFKENGLEAFITKKKKKQQPLVDNKVNNSLAFGSDEEEMYEQTLQYIAQHSSANTNDCLLFDPDSQGSAAWQVAGLFMIIYQSIVIPFRLCFEAEAEGNWIYIETTIDVCFILDIFVQFNTGFYSQGKLINNRYKIIINYLKSWFLIDLVASFPYDWIVSQPPSLTNAQDPLADPTDLDQNQDLAQSAQLLRLIKFTRFLRFLRLLRVFKLKQILYRIEELIMNDALVAAMNLFKVVAVVIFIGHWIACIFFAIGAYEIDLETDCWLVNADLIEKTQDEQYIASLYWAFATMTTVGYGDLHPISELEMLYAMLAMLISCGVFAYVVGSIETIVRQSNTIENEFKEKILHINQYLLQKDIPPQLRKQVRRYLEQRLEHKKKEKLNQNEVLKMLNTNLKDEVLIQIVGGIIRKQRLFVTMFDDRLQSEILFMLKQRTVLMDDHIFEEGDKCDRLDDTDLLEGPEKQHIEDSKQGEHRIYFIIQGQVRMIYQKNTVLKELTVDDVFGEISFFTGLPRKVTAKSRNFSELMYLSDKEFLDTIDKKFKHTHSKFLACKEKLLKAQYDDSPDRYKYLFINCYICQARGHIASECQFLQEIQNKQNQKQPPQLHDHEIKEVKEFLKQNKQIQEQMHQLLAEVSIPAEARRSNLQERQSQCFHPTDENAESPPNNNQDETLREVEIPSSEWIRESVYLESNNEDDSAEGDDEADQDGQDHDEYAEETDQEDSNSVRTDPESSARVET